MTTDQTIMNLRFYGTMLVFLIFSMISAALANDRPADVAVDDGRIRLRTEFVQKDMTLENNRLISQSCEINGKKIMADDSFECAFRLSRATPNEEPVGFVRDANVTLEFNDAKNETEKAKTLWNQLNESQNVRWSEVASLRSDTWGDVFRKSHCIVSRPKSGVTRLNVRFASLDHPELSDLTVNLFYEVYDGYPAIRKWFEVTNNGPLWLKIDELILDGTKISESFNTITDLTPVEYGAIATTRSYSNADFSSGVIVASEIPSGLRMIYPDGTMGYANQYFEWVLGPTETFVSEPVFHYAFDGKTYQTISASSTELDRQIESPYKNFLYEHVGVKRVNPSRFVPLWCSWTNFRMNVTHENMVEMAELAEKCGFRGFLIDDSGRGYSEVDTPRSVLPDVEKFPDFAKTAEIINSHNLAIGLWVSCFRRPDFDPDFDILPESRIYPNIYRDKSKWVPMSFQSKWRYYFANTLLRLRDEYGIRYFKQDFSNIKFGDIVLGHEGRTLKESILRGLRGLLEAQDVMNHAAPDINLELTHEIYWGTPGVPCDLAALKHAHTYHIPPNSYYGGGHIGQRVNDSWLDNPKYAPEELRKSQQAGSFFARQRFYAHRALPMQCIEFYGACAVNFHGSLTPEIQRRQICSWLLGTPSVFAGDLASLTEENIGVYRKCFDLIAEMNRKHDIYLHFQYSGVPAPTDADWHWWGKLNDSGEGIVVVLRGNAGDDARRINIPWVDPAKKYRVFAHFAGQSPGVFSGQDLIDGKLQLALPNMGQEILELILEPNPSAGTVGNVPDLPNVLILGDSISIGYTPHVRKLLAGKADVYRPMQPNGKGAINCGNTKMGIAGLEQWLANDQIRWDVIHFNWGLWDINRRIPHNQDNQGVRDKVNGTISFTEQEYGENLEKIVARLKKTGAKLVWANTTHVPEGEEGRRLGDDLLYNEVAEKVMKKHGIPINDLNALTRSLDPAMMLKPGDVHYQSEGYEMIARQVAEIILSQTAASKTP